MVAMQGRKRFFVLDALRGLSALCVVLFHVHVAGAFSELPFFRGSDGFVYFFFVLSGFVLSHRYLYDEDLSIKKYIKSRTLRLWPLHVVMLSVMVLVEVFKFFAQKMGFVFNNSAFSGINHPISLLPNIFLLHVWLPYAHPWSYNYPSWSVSVEYYVYFLFLGFLMLRETARIVFLLLVFVASFVCLQHSLDLGAHYVALGALCFFLGVLCYSLFCVLSPLLGFLKNLATLLECSLAFMLVVSLSTPHLDELALIPLFFIIVFFFSLEMGGVSKLLLKSPFQYLGKISYSIYLVHASVLSFFIFLFVATQRLIGFELAPILAGKRTLDLGYSVLNNLFVFGILFVVIVVSGFTYSYVERRYRLPRDYELMS